MKHRYSKIYSASLAGIDGYLVDVEVDIAGGNPGITIVGLPDTAIKESKERVRSAISNSGLPFPLRRITVNLAPADIHKEGPIFELSIALGILFAQSDTITIDDTLIIGELALDGRVRPVKGVLPITQFAKEADFASIIVPAENAKEAAIIEGIDVYGVENLTEAIDFIGGKISIKPTVIDREALFRRVGECFVDLSEVKGQEHAKRALEIGASGGHNIIMLGPPGSGKTMLARRLPTILPPMTLEEALETTKIHSIVGLLPKGKPLITERPFRSPHHSVSDAGLIGGGQVPKPGEISLAHNGVLFIDEIPEMDRNVLEAIRQPMEDGNVTISRAQATYTFPARFTLVASMNPCPCGYYGSPTKRCTCTPNQIASYRRHISGPVMDRIDIQIEVPALEFEKMTAMGESERSSSIRERVIRARERQRERFKDLSGIYANSQMTGKLLKEFVKIDDTSRQLLSKAVDRFGLSARAYDRILKVARTIADIEGSENVSPAHISEAIQYRVLDRKML